MHLNDKGRARFQAFLREAYGGDYLHWFVDTDALQTLLEIELNAAGAALPWIWQHTPPGGWRAHEMQHFRVRPSDCTH